MQERGMSIFSQARENVVKLWSALAEQGSKQSVIVSLRITGIFVELVDRDIGDEIGDSFAKNLVVSTRPRTNTVPEASSSTLFDSSLFAWKL